VEQPVATVALWSAIEAKLMRVAVVIPVRWNASHFTTDPRWIAAGLVACGHDPVIVCLSGSDEPADAPVQIAIDRELRTAAFWRRHQIDWALVFTWMNNAGEIVSAVREADAIVLSKGDTDGFLGVRANPARTLERAVYGQTTVRGRARASWHWLKRYVRLHQAEDRAVLDNLRCAHATVVETERARINLGRFLDRHHALSLLWKIQVVPNAISPDIAEAPLQTEKRRRIVSIGRWDDPQKAARTLARVQRCFSRADHEFVVLGGGGEGRFGSGARAPVRYLGRVPHDEIKHHLGSARICLLTSRWEGSHIAGHEALAMGCTVVGPPIPAVLSMTDGGSFGAVAEARTPRALVHALVDEVQAWDAGVRDPLRIAGAWRSRLAPGHVASRLIDIFEAATDDG
jgi:glycosyltransferase involved in cell wall biosynthesis